MMVTAGTLAPGGLKADGGGFALHPEGWKAICDGMATLETLGREARQMPPRAAELLNEAQRAGTDWRERVLPCSKAVAEKTASLAEGLIDIARTVGKETTPAQAAGSLEKSAEQAREMEVDGKELAVTLGEVTQELSAVSARLPRVRGELQQSAAENQKKIENLRSDIASSGKKIDRNYREYRRLYDEINSKPGTYAIPIYGQVRLVQAIQARDRAEGHWRQAKAEQVRREALIEAWRRDGVHLQAQANHFNAGVKQVQALGDGRLNIAIRAVTLLHGAFRGLGSDLGTAARTLANLDPQECDNVLLEWDLVDVATEWNEIRQDARSFVNLVCRV